MYNIWAIIKWDYLGYDQETGRHISSRITTVIKNCGHTITTHRLILSSDTPSLDAWYGVYSVKVFHGKNLILYVGTSDLLFCNVNHVPKSLWKWLIKCAIFSKTGLRNKNHNYICVAPRIFHKTQQCNYKVRSLKVCSHFSPWFHLTNYFFQPRLKSLQFCGLINVERSLVYTT